jgi:hypothetical protein
LNDQKHLRSECQHSPGYGIFREYLRSSWEILDKKVSLIDWDRLKQDMSVWIVWNECFEDVFQRSKDAGQIMSVIMLESILQNTVPVDLRAHMEIAVHTEGAKNV